MDDDIKAKEFDGSEQQAGASGEVLAGRC